MNLDSSYPEVSDYYQILRKDILNVIPPSAVNILSVGCASGLTEYELIKKGKTVVGVELNPQAAELARKRGVKVLQGDAGTVDVSQGCDLYDTIVYADVLEHILSPVDVIKKHLLYLKPGGIVYITVPNFRHYKVLWQLFGKGHILYADAGILDRTHIRITTRKMVSQWVSNTGLVSLKTNHLIHGRRNKLISMLTAGLFKEFLADQVAIIAQKP